MNDISPSIFATPCESVIIIKILYIEILISLRQLSALLDAPPYMPFMKTMVLTHHETWEKLFLSSGLIFLICKIDAAAAAAKLLQSCPTLCDPIDGSPPGSLIPGILQARTLEWVAISFSNAWEWKVKGKSLSCFWPSATPWTAAHQAPPSMGFSSQEYWSGVPLPSPVKRIGWFKTPRGSKILGLYTHSSGEVCISLGSSLVCQWYRIYLQCSRSGFDPWVRKIPWRRKWQSTPVFLPGKSHGQRRLAGYSSQGRKRVRYNLAAKQQHLSQVIQWWDISSY